MLSEVIKLGDIPGVDSNYFFDQFIKQAKEIKDGLIFMNIQETDFARHSEDTDHYADILEIMDKRLPEAEQPFTGEDILIVMADYGDDPTIGYAQHTREKVPLLIIKKKSIVNTLVKEPLLQILVLLVLNFLVSKCHKMLLVLLIQ